jgi:hypothetical protein
VILAAARLPTGDNFLAGLLVGVFIGIVAGPLLWHWLARRWWEDADREIRLTDRLIERLDEDGQTPRDGREARAS